MFCRSSSGFCFHIVEEDRRLGTLNMYMATVLLLGQSDITDFKWLALSFIMLAVFDSCIY